MKQKAPTSSVFFLNRNIEGVPYLAIGKPKTMKNNYKTMLVAALAACSTILSAQIPMAWAERYNAPPDMQDEGRSVAVDASGNVFVTGSGFNSGGNLDVITVKYDQDGNQMWVRNYDRGLNDNDEGKMLTLDAAGNIYVTGYSRGNGTSLDIITIMYDNAGTQQWASFYNGGANGMDEGKSIAVDGSGNVFVCGYESDSSFYYNAVTLKYNSSGAQQWVQVYNGTISGSDELVELVLDASSNVYVTGNTEASSANYDYLTIKYNSAGVQQWLQTYNGASSGSDYGKGITLDFNNNVIVTGQSFATNNWQDYLTIKYTNAGVQQWTARYNNAANRFEDAWDVISDNAGYVYVTGQSQATGNNSTPPDCATVKYTPAGNQVWVKRWDGGFANEDDRAFAIGLDDTANVYIAGYSKNAANFDGIVVKYDSSGTEEWNVRYNSQYNQNDQNLAMVVKNGDIYIAGKTANAANEDFLTIRYSYSAVGIQENPLNQNGMSSYPVPFTDVLNIEFTNPNGAEASCIQISDVAGRVIGTYNIQEGAKTAQIGTSELPSGCYVVTQISQDGQLISRQLVIRD